MPSSNLDSIAKLAKSDADSRYFKERLSMKNTKTSILKDEKNIKGHIDNAAHPILGIRQLIIISHIKVAYRIFLHSL